MVRGLSFHLLLILNLNRLLLRWNVVLNDARVGHRLGNRACLCVLARESSPVGVLVNQTHHRTLTLLLVSSDLGDRYSLIVTHPSDSQDFFDSCIEC
jgi:hypothetical protein